MKQNNPPKRITSTILNALKGGVVPRVGLEYVAVGRDKEIDALLHDIGIIAVSYTHLDVYKRQDMPCSLMKEGQFFAGLPMRCPGKKLWFVCRTAVFARRCRAGQTRL